MASQQSFLIVSEVGKCSYQNEMLVMSVGVEIVELSGRMEFSICVLKSSLML